jgi:transcriptional regulator with XRE-family HTH domain
MRIPTLLRQIRLDQSMSLTDVEELTGISRGTLSQIETGRSLPADKDLAQLELAYGPPHGWYEPAILFLLQRDREEVEA